MTCKSCGLDHRGWVSCAKARTDSMRPVHVFEAPRPPDSLIERGWNESATVANMIPEVANTVANALTGNKHGKYADKEKRLAYMRELMRKRRAKPADT